MYFIKRYKMWNKVLGIKSQDLWLKAEITDENSKHN